MNTLARTTRLKRARRKCSL